jgi:hypothetical protein
MWQPVADKDFKLSAFTEFKRISTKELGVFLARYRVASKTIFIRKLFQELSRFWTEVGGRNMSPRPGNGNKGMTILEERYEKM